MLLYVHIYHNIGGIRYEKAYSVHLAPVKVCTRGQIVTFLWRNAGSPEPQSQSTPLTDTKEGRFYFNAVLWAAENDITQGITAQLFKPKNTCTRGQIVTFLYRCEN